MRRVLLPSNRRYPPPHPFQAQRHNQPPPPLPPLQVADLIRGKIVVGERKQPPAAFCLPSTPSPPFPSPLAPSPQVMRFETIGVLCYSATPAPSSATPAPGAKNCTDASRLSSSCASARCCRCVSIARHSLRRRPPQVRESFGRAGDSGDGLGAFACGRQQGFHAAVRARMRADAGTVGVLLAARLTLGQVQEVPPEVGEGRYEAHAECGQEKEGCGQAAISKGQREEELAGIVKILLSFIPPGPARLQAQRLHGDRLGHGDGLLDAEPLLL